MPSSGKSTLGRRLAKELGYTFIDLDQMIVNDQDLSIPDIFSKYGENYFREVESRLLKSIAPNQKYLVATGGGAPCFFDNMDYILESGVSVYLDVPVEELAQRIKEYAKDDRPLLSGLTDLETALAAKLAERVKYYSRAHLTLDSETNFLEFIQLLQRLVNE